MYIYPMKRFLIDKLVGWKTKKGRLPLILRGARQVGKTHLMRQFGCEYFPDLYEFNFESSPKLGQLFSGDLVVDRIVEELGKVIGRKILPEGLLFLDEIQNCPEALAALKYFAEYLPEQHIICAGSLLGVALSTGSYPVGKVEYLWLGPMTFREFLAGIGDLQALEYLGGIVKKLSISELGHEHLWRRLKDFYVTGGLPRPVAVFAEQRDDLHAAWNSVRAVQHALVRDYMSDFSKYTGSANAQHIRAVFENVPEQLSVTEDRSTAKYRFAHVVPGRRGYVQLQAPIDWLVNAGLTYKVKVANKAGLPLISFSKDNYFKLYHLDIGLLGAMLNLPPAVLQLDDYGQGKGYFAESVALQGLVENNFDPLFAWAEGQSEIEFLTVADRGIVPIEVKSGSRTRAKSLLSYCKKYSPEMAIKLAKALPGYNATTRVWTLPLYLAWDVRKIIER